MQSNLPVDPYLKALNDATKGRLIRAGLIWVLDTGGYSSSIPTHQIAAPLIAVIRKAAQEASLDPLRIRLESLQGMPIAEEQRKALKPAEGIMGKIVIPEDYASNETFITSLSRRNEELEQTRFNAAHSFIEEIMRSVKNSKGFNR